MSNPLDFWGDGGFRTGLVAGSGVTAAALVAAVAGRKRSLPPVGLPLVIAVVGVMHVRFGVPAGLVAGLVTLGAAGLLRGVAMTSSRRLLSSPGLWLVPAAVGGWLVGWHTGLPDVNWLRGLAAVTAAAGGACVANFDARWAARGLGPVLVAVTVVGVYFTVPDTREALVLLGVALPVAAVGWPVPAGRLGGGGSFAFAGLLAWVVVTGGHGRQSSVVGGMACLGLLVLEPFFRGFSTGAWSPLDVVLRGWSTTPAVGAGHLAFVFVAARVAGVSSPTEYRQGEPLARGGVVFAVAIVAAEVAAFGLLCALVRLLATLRKIRSRNLR